MAMFPATSRRRFAPGVLGMPALLATTSVAALLMATPLPAHAAGISVTGNAANVDNPANTTVTSIVVNAANVSGAVTNEGTVKPGKAVTVGSDNDGHRLAVDDQHDRPGRLANQRSRSRRRPKAGPASASRRQRDHGDAAAPCDARRQQSTALAGKKHGGRHMNVIARHDRARVDAARSPAAPHQSGGTLAFNAAQAQRRGIDDRAPLEHLRGGTFEPSDGVDSTRDAARHDVGARHRGGSPLSGLANVASGNRAGSASTRHGERARRVAHVSADGACGERHQPDARDGARPRCARAS